MQYSQSSHIETRQGAGVVILDRKERILLVLERGSRKNPSKAGLWHLPAGKVEKGEFPEDAAVREAWEETGLKVRLLKFLGTRAGWLSNGKIMLRSVWLAEPLAGQRLQPNFSDEIADARYFSAQEVEDLRRSGKLRMYTTPLFFEDALKAHKMLKKA